MAVLIAILLHVFFLISPAQAQQSLRAEDIFSSVRDQTSFQVYGGSLHKLEEIESLTSGNSLDRALLLYKRFKDAGYRPELIQGVLRGERLPDLLAFFFGCSRELIVEKISGKDPMLERMARQLRDHFWVRLPSGENGFINYDPSLPDSSPGQTLGNFRKTLKRLPSDSFQRYEIVVTASFKVGHARARSRLVRYVGSVQDDLGKRITLFFVNKDINENFEFIDQLPIYPVLNAGGEIQPAINLREEAARIAVTQNVPTPDIRPEKVWLEIVYTVPGRKAKKISRILYDDSLEGVNWLRTVAVFKIFEPGLDPHFSVDGKAFDTIDAQWKPAFLSVLSEKEKRQVRDRMRAAGELGEGVLSLYSASVNAAQQRLLAGVDTSIRQAVRTPTFAACLMNPEMGTIELDVMHHENNFYSVLSDRAECTALNMACGVAATALEPLILESVLTEGKVDSAFEQLSLAASDTSRTWLTLDASQIPRLSALKVPSPMIKIMTDVLVSGNSLLVPGEATPTAWMTFDSTSGALLGMHPPGTGGARAWQEQRADDAEAYHFSSISSIWGDALKKMGASMAGQTAVSAGALSARLYGEHLEEVSTLLAVAADYMAPHMLNEEYSSARLRMELRKIIDSSANTILTNSKQAAPESATEHIQR